MNDKWEIYTRGSIPPHRADFFAAMSQAIGRPGAVRSLLTFYANEGEKLWWCWSKKEITTWGDKLLARLDKEKARDEYYRRYIATVKKAIKATEKVRKENLAKASNADLIKLYDYLGKEASPAVGLLLIEMDAFDVVSENFLKKIIKNKLIENKITVADQEFSEIYRDLSAPAYQTFVSQEEEEIIRLALQKKVSNQAVAKVYQKFWWVSLGWENLRPRTPDYYRREIAKWRKKGNLKKNLAAGAEHLKNISRCRQEVVKKYNFGAAVNYWLEVFDKFAYLHDLRKEMQVRAIFSFNLLLSEAAKRFKIKADEQEFLFRADVKKILAGGRIDKKEITRRKIATVVIASRSGLKIFSGDKAIALRKKEMAGDYADVQELKGTGATKGKVTGIVKVCQGAEEGFEKMKPGDILVTGMTLPDYVPIMKIARAIITDEGGITCHAAIISRELGIPCIVGTKIATQVLRDGDLVEVDAGKGVVKILK